MNTEKIISDLPSKQRSVKDLIRFIRTRTDENSNYTLFLGAGCSVTSGVRSAESLVQAWRKEVYLHERELKEGEKYDPQVARDYLISKCGNWYNPSKEYSSLFEKKYDLPRQRRMFIEQEVAGKIPSLGYAYVTKLVRHGYLNTIFTTNYDDLVNEAFYQYSDMRPIVCAHDSSVSSITVASKRPKVIKLHGDYLYDDIKSTLRETESLEDNIKNKFVEFCKDYGLIVVGYGGCDRSVMDVLSYLLKLDDYIKTGIYWCLTRGAEVGEELRKLLWKDRAYYVVIDGFDELFAEINHAMFGNDLPIESAPLSIKSNDFISGFVNNVHLQNSESAYIQGDLKKLRKENSKNLFFDVLKRIGRDSSDETIDPAYSNSELMTILALEESYLVKEKYDEVVRKGKESLSENLGINARIRILQVIAHAHERLDEYGQAAHVYDELARIDSGNPSHFIEKARLVSTNDAKLELLEEAIEANPYHYRPYYEKAEILREIYIGATGGDRSKVYNDVVGSLQKGILVYPVVSNPCYLRLLHMIKRRTGDEAQKKKEMGELEAYAMEQDRFDPDTLRIRFDALSENATPQEIDTLLQDAQTAIQRRYRRNLLNYHILIIDLMARFNKNDELEDYLCKLDVDEKYKNDAIYLIGKARVKLSKFGKLDEALDLARNAYELRKTKVSADFLCTLYAYAERYEDALQVLAESRGVISKRTYFNQKLRVYEWSGRFGEARDVMQRLHETGVTTHGQVLDKSYLYILRGKYEEAREVLRKYLESVNYCLDADVHIINYELCNSKLGKTVHKDRLSSVIKHTDGNVVKAAACVLMGDFQDALNWLEKELKTDLSEKYLIAHYPVFERLRADTRYQGMINVGDRFLAEMSNVVPLAPELQ